MPLVFPIIPAADESLAGFVVRAAAENFLRSPLSELREIDIRTAKLGSLCCRSPSLAHRIATWAGTKDVEGVQRMFHPLIDGRAGWIDFFGEPLRALYRQVGRRRVAPAALKMGDYARATWSLNVFSFDLPSKEKLIDSCPQCKRALGWTRTYGVAYCDYCSRPEAVGEFTFHYPGLDLRDFPQPKIEVDDEEALDFLTGLIDPSPERKARARKLVPELWSELGNGDLFEVGITFAGMLNVDHWDNRQSVRRKSKAGEGWDWLTPRMLAIGARALMGGQPGFEAFGDIVRHEVADRPRERRYGKWAEIGPLSIIEPSLCDTAKAILRRAIDAYVTARRDPDMQPLQSLAEKHGIDRRGLKALADSGLLRTSKTSGVKRGPVLMSAKALEPLIAKIQASISGMRAAPMVGVHVMHLDGLTKLGLLERVEGPVLKLLKSETYYTRASVKKLVVAIKTQVKSRRPQDCVRLRVALRARNVRTVPWPGIVRAILDGRLEVFGMPSDRSRRSLADRLAVRHAAELSDLVAKELGGTPRQAADWIGNATAAEILGVSEVVVWRLAKVGVLRKHPDAPLYSHFKRSEVEHFNGQMIFTPEIVRAGSFRTYREASTWLQQQGIVPRFELKQGGWKVYRRVEVETRLKRRVETLPPNPVPPPRPKGPRHAPDSPQGRLAAALESTDDFRVGYATAAKILGSTIFAVQKLAANEYLHADGKIAPFARSEVESLAKRIIFVPEIMMLSGYESHVGVMNWLNNAGIEPLLWLKVGGVPVFARAVVEEHVARPEFSRGAHPRWIKRKLLDMVDRGRSVHQASIACGVSYATAKTWARQEQSRTVRAGRGEYPLSVKHKLLDMVDRGSTARDASVACGVIYRTALRWTRNGSNP